MRKKHKTRVNSIVRITLGRSMKGIFLDFPLQLWGSLEKNKTDQTHVSDVRARTLILLQYILLFYPSTRY
jgi:hypothetical protein